MSSEQPPDNEYGKVVDLASFRAKKAEEEEAKALEVTPSPSQEYSRHRHFSEEEQLNERILALIHYMERQDEILEMVVHDVVLLTSQTEKQRLNLMNLTANISALIALLDQKGTISKEEFNDIWEEEYLPILEQFTSSSNEDSQ